MLCFGCIAGLLNNLYSEFFSFSTQQLTQPSVHWYEDSFLPRSAPDNGTPVHTTSSTTPLERVTRMNKYINKYNYTPPTSHMVHSLEHQCGSGPDFGNFFNLSYRERSRLDEDKIIYEKLFKNANASAGTYIELGAFDVSQEAKTRFFDVCLGWKGLLIEGNPINFQKALRARPNAHRMSFAPSCSAEYEAVNGTVPFYRYPM